MEGRPDATGEKFLIWKEKESRQTGQQLMPSKEKPANHLLKILRSYKNKGKIWGETSLTSVSLVNFFISQKKRVAEHRILRKLKKCVFKAGTHGSKVFFIRCPVFLLVRVWRGFFFSWIKPDLEGTNHRDLSDLFSSIILLISVKQMAWETSTLALH